MPGAGLATVREIGARLPEAKLVVLTVSGKDSDLFVALPSGVHGYLLKTMDLDRLPDTLTWRLLHRSGHAAYSRRARSRVLPSARAALAANGQYRAHPAAHQA